MQTFVEEGHRVVLDENGTKRTLIIVKSDGSVRVGKSQVSTRPFVGAPYGSMFQLSADGTRLERIARPPGSEAAQSMEIDKNNSQLMDNNQQNQALTQDDIHEMRKAGKTGEEIIEALCSRSTTFESKTEYAQEKYRKRKAQKYMTYVVLRRPTGSSVCQAYFDKSAHKVWNLRPDSLALMLHLANVGAGAQVLVLENCAGLVTAAVAERLGGVGVVCAAAIGGRAAPLDALQLMNFTPPQRAAIVTATLAQLQRARADSAAATADGGNASDAAAQESNAAAAAAGSTTKAAGAGSAGAAEGDESDLAATAVATLNGTATAGDRSSGVDNGDASGMAVDAHGGEADGAAMEAMELQGLVGAATDAGPAHNGVDQDQQDAGVGLPSSTAPSALERQPLQLPNSFRATTAGLRLLAGTGFSSCVVASPRLDCVAVVEALLPLLRPSASLVVFSPWLEPLARCTHHLQSGKAAVMVQLQESWARQYQVLPNRTHPLMAMSGTGGYVLSAIKVQEPDPSEHQHRQPRATQPRHHQGKRQRT